MTFECVKCRAWTAHLPESYSPASCQMVSRNERSARWISPARCAWGEAARVRGVMKGIHDFAEYVELALRMRLIADPHRSRAGVPRQPREFQLGRRRSPAKTVHDVELRRGRRRAARNSHSRQARASSA